MAAAVREGSSPATTAITATTPPVIAKAGRYTVFLTPKPSADTQINTTPPKSSSSSYVRPLSSKPSPTTPSPPPPPPLVQVPTPQLEGDLEEKSSGAFGFFWNAAVVKVKRGHWSLDEFLADWIGLDQSKYQWALNDYYEYHGMDKEGGKQEEASC